VRYLITGFKGQLGYDIKRELESRDETDVIAIDKEEMDITKKEEVEKFILEKKPDVIFHCAAYTAVDKAEVDEDVCQKVNVLGTKNIVDASIKANSKIIYMSTDYVFDGKKESPYTEEDQVNPENIYGRTKYLGELEVKRNPKHYITRISWVFGINGNNFIKTMLNLSKTHSELNVVCDQIGSPTYTVDLAKILVDMAQTDKYGTYNVTNDEYCSWAEFAEYIFKINNIKMEIKRVTSKEYPQVAVRPKNSRLDKSKLKKNFSILPSWKDATKRYCTELNNKN